MNPFMKNGMLLPIASVNSIYVDDILAYDLFRPALIINELENKRDLLGYPKDLSGQELLFSINDTLSSEISSIKEEANNIATQFGDNLARVIVTLKKPSDLSKKNRIDWNDEHWGYWKNITHIFIVGGLTSPLLTKIFHSRIMKKCQENQIDDLKVTFIEGSSNLGTKGLSTIVGNGEYLLFDFGQTNIKRQHVIKKHDILAIDNVLQNINSDYLFYKYKDETELKQIAKLLDNYILKVIKNTCKEVGFKGDTIHMGIANYVYNGAIFSHRGGYGKLAYIAENYASHLSMALSKDLGRNISLKLYHDTSAMALNFQNELGVAVISLGTAFGVAFVDKK